MATYTALSATRRAIAGHDYLPLVELIERERGKRRSAGRPPAWLKCSQSARELAAAILYVIFESRLRAQDDEEAQLSLQTVASALSFDLVPHLAESRRWAIGVQLLFLAEEAGIIEILRDGEFLNAPYYVRLQDRTFQLLEAIANGSVLHIRNRVRLFPPVGVETKQKWGMKLERPNPPARVQAAGDKVQGTPWRINQAVLNALSEDRDSQIGEALTSEAEIELPHDNSILLAQAHEMRSEPRFYFPVFLDFRGRFNQRSTILNYTGGSDYARGLLEFAVPQVLNADGRKWLSWHLARMCGATVEFGDGLKWVAATDLHAIDWRKVEKTPVQFLAARNAWWDVISGKPCHLPVRLDATCSGMQHLVLMTRDKVLAPHLNLWGAAPEDADVANAWLEIPIRDYYSLVAEKAGVDRGLAKAVLMPMQYTAGEKASAGHVAEYLKETPDKTHLAIAKHIRAVAKSEAPVEFELMEWFKRVAEAHNGAKGEAAIPIRWSTPTGLEVIQDYRCVDTSGMDRKRIDITVDGRRFHLAPITWADAILKHQQVTSLPANIVHSMDAALLVEIVDGADIDSWAVAHDAFGVPANDVPKLRAANYGAMRTLYGADRLAEWAAAWRAAGVKVRDPPGTRGALPDAMVQGLRPIS